MWIDIIIYTPMYVTFFWAVVLLLSANKRNKARSFLGVFMIAAFLVYLSHAVFFQQHEISYLVFDPIYILASLSVYPLYYWYIKLLTIETVFKWKNIRMLIPAIVLSMSSVIIYFLMSPEERRIYILGFLLKTEEISSESILFQFQKVAFYISRMVFTVQVIFFLINGRKLVIRFNVRVANFYSNLESKTLIWVNFLLSSFVITSIASIIFNIIGRHLFLNSVLLLLMPALIFTVLLFFIGYQGYMQNHTVVNLVEDEELNSANDIKEYNKIQLKENLLELFAEKKIYMNSELKISNVSELLQTNRTYVSNLINYEFKVSFSEYVNQYRINEAKKMLEDFRMKNYSLNYISEVVGFGSLNTFIRVFKESEGLTPGKYREKYKSSILANNQV